MAHDQQDDLQLPIANVGRIMKQILPPSAKVSKEAREIMQDCVSEFVKFVTGEASDRCRKENRKTVNGDDICWALRALGFDECAEAIARYLYKYREFERERLNHKVQNEVDGAETPTPLVLFKVTDQNDGGANQSLKILIFGF